ncbi:MAG TPA: TolC family protein [Sunxiuqinia sp.]|nr:TolC family protein [Sunxiuqinia sp.]
MKQLMIFILACFLVFPKVGFGQETYDLQKLLKQALENNPDIKKSTLKQTESDYKTKEAISHGLPQIDGNLQYSRMGIPDLSALQGMAAELPDDLKPLLAQLQGLNALHILSTGVTVSQMVYSQPYFTGVKQAKKAEELNDVLAEKTQDDVIYDVSKVFYQLLSNYESLKVLDETVANMEKISNILDLQYKNDLAKKTDVSRVKVQLSNLRTQRDMLQNGIRIRERVLKIVCGIPVDKEMVPDTTQTKDSIIQQPATPAFSIEKLPEFQLLQKQQELASLKVKSEQADYYPNLAVFGQFNYSSYSTQFDPSSLSNTNTFGLKATIPIWSSGERKCKVMQSRLQLQEFNEDFETSKKQLGTSYQNSLNTLLTSWKGLKDQKENKALAHEVYDQVRLSYQEGMTSLTDLLNVETSMLDAENLYNQQLLKYRIASLDMKKSTGNLQSMIKVENQ